MNMVAAACEGNLAVMQQVAGGFNTIITQLGALIAGPAYMPVGAVGAWNQIPPAPNVNAQPETAMGSAGASTAVAGTSSIVDKDMERREKE
jgi:hypothetical protein